MQHMESFYQKVVVNWIKNNHPDILFTCAPAVAKSARQGHENRLMGYCKGWPDLFFAIPKKGWYGLFIELKTEKGKVQPEQEAIIERLNNLGYKAMICRSPEVAIMEIKNYLKIV